jgi:dTDP-glucose 4,6-dehydratase
MRLDDGRVVPNFIVQALSGQPLTVFGDGMQTRSFCYVDDLVEGLHRLLLSDYNQPINLGNPVEMTILELAELINEMTGNNAGVERLQGRRDPDDPQRREPDISRAMDKLAWEPETDLKEGLQKTIDDFKDRMG